MFTVEQEALGGETAHNLVFRLLDCGWINGRFLDASERQRCEEIDRWLLHFPRMTRDRTPCIAIKLTSGLCRPPASGCHRQPVACLSRNTGLDPVAWVFSGVPLSAVGSTSSSSEARRFKTEDDGVHHEGLSRLQPGRNRRESAWPACPGRHWQTRRVPDGVSNKVHGSTSVSSFFPNF